MTGPWHRELSDDAILRIALDFGTPLFLIDGTQLRRRFGALQSLLSEVQHKIYYSCKANNSVAVSRLLVACGAGIDACSPYDLAVADIAGAGGADIIYSSCSVGASELSLVAASGALFSANSLGQLTRYLALAPGRDVSLRLRCPVDGGATRFRNSSHNSKFGVMADEVSSAVAVAAHTGSRIVGLHCHVGSEIRTPATFGAVGAFMLSVIDNCPDLQFLDFGGGWAPSYTPSDVPFDVGAFTQAISPILAQASERLSRVIGLRVEPGAYLVAEGCYLIAEVNEVRISEVTSTAYVNTSCNHIFAAGMYDAAYYVERLSRDPSGGTAIYDIAGELMQAQDVLARRCCLPTLTIGDLILFHSCGNYCSSRSTTFNGRPRPAEVLVDGDSTVLVRRRETVNDLLAPQSW